MKRQIDLNELRAGAILQWNVYDADNRLLLRRGQIIESDRQIEELIERGLFTEGAKITGITEATPPPEKSAVAMILAARRRLAQACSPQVLNSADHPTHVPRNFPELIMRICTMIKLACKLNRDAALATTVLNREGGYGIRHSVDTAMITQTVGGFVGMQEAELNSITAAALTMNISMLPMQDNFQNRKEPLSEHQRLALELHPQASADMLNTLGVNDELWIGAVLDHHEAIDGTGYPARKKEDNLLMSTRILTLSDIYCARVSGRNYRPPLRPNAALRSIFLDQGSSVEKVLAAQFIKALGVFPPGTAVLLNNGEMGIVVKQGEKTNTPTVCSVINPNGIPFVTPVKRDTGIPLYAIKNTLDWSALGRTVSMQALWGQQGSST